MNSLGVPTGKVSGALESVDDIKAASPIDAIWDAASIGHLADFNLAALAHYKYQYQCKYRSGPWLLLSIQKTKTEAETEAEAKSKSLSRSGSAGLTETVPKDRILSRSVCLTL